METHNYQYQAPRQPMFNGTVFVTVLAALIVFAALCFGGFMLFQKIKQNEGQPTLSNEEIEAQKAINAQSVLASGLTKSKKIVEPIVEEAKETVEEVVQTIQKVEEDFNDTMSDFLLRKVPHLVTVHPNKEPVSTEQASAEIEQTSAELVD